MDETRPRIARSNAPSGRHRLEEAGPAIQITPSHSLAARLPGVPGEGRGSQDAQQSAVLALRPLALVLVDELAAAGAAELSPLRRRLFLVPQPQKHQLRGVRRANVAPLTGH
jgi:hypothetical protein